ncbi:MAG: ABC transporter ATP-binding protein [Acidobacteria bacterium]|nr:MAG: ABC transporter ATP-binding protein [Acidobacteriota bacterium]
MAVRSSSVAWHEARDIIWERRYRLSLGFLLMIVGRLAGLVLPATSKFLVDEVIGNARAELLPPLAAAAGLATLVQASTGFALSQILGVAAQKAITDLRKSVHDHVLQLPTAYFDSVKSGELISRIMTDAEGIRNLVGTGLVQLSGGFLTATIALSVLFYLNWRLTSLTLIVLSLFGGMMAFAFTRLRPLFRKRGELNATATGRLAEALGGIRIVKSYTAEKREGRIFGSNVDALFENVKKAVTAMAGVSAGSTIIFGTVGVLMILVGGRSILSGAMTLGDFVMYIFFTGLVAAPLVQISSISTQLSEAFAGLDRIRELRSRSTELEQDQARMPLPTVFGHIAFEDVSFAYTEGVPVLKHISFEAPAGTTTALVGSSGSGKSTLASLVLVFNRPQSGRVLIDGQDLAEIRLGDYRSHLGVVLQDNFLFDGTVSDNIVYSRPDASEQDIREASRIAHCDGFISGFENGYDTVVGERGVKLSGGQRQRIAIARAILADPKILILDEATSSLDSESESMIQDGLRSLRTGRTTFVIAHRLSTIISSEQILVIEDGEIVERGHHEELLKKGGRYRELYDRQYKLEMNRFINPGEDFTPADEEPEPSPAGFDPRKNL